VIDSPGLIERLEQFFSILRERVDHDALERVVTEGLSFSQARVMGLIGESGEPIPINVIGERLGLSIASAGRNVEQLVQRGYLERTECAEDRRVRLVSATDAGREMLAGHVDVWRDALERLIADLPPEVAGRLDAALEAVLRHIAPIHQR